MGHINCVECLKEAQLRWDTVTVCVSKRGTVKVGHINCVECLKEAQLRWDILSVLKRRS